MIAPSVRAWIRSALASAGYVVFNSRSRVYYAKDSLSLPGNENSAEVANSAAASLGADVLSLPTGQGLGIK